MTLRIKRPDRKDALSILNAAKMQMDFTLSMKVSEEAGFTIIRNIYECFRMLGDSLLVKQGIESQDHLEPIRALLEIQIKTERPVNIIESLRLMRHNINYYGYMPTIQEVEDAISFAKCCFYVLFEEVKKKIES